MILAEDRLLCLGLFTKPRNKFTLRYVPNAFANTDPVDDLFELFNQRRRWINGSWYALLIFAAKILPFTFISHRYALDHVIHFQNDIQDSTHSIFQKMLFFFSLFYAKLNMIVVYFSLSLNLIVTKLALDIQFSEYYVIGQRGSLAGLLFLLYLALIMLVLFVCLQAKPRDLSGSGIMVIRRAFQWTTHILGLFTLGLNGLIASILIREYAQSKDIDYFSYVLITLVASFGSYVLLTLLNPALISAIVCNFISYMYYAPTYINSLMLFAFCNIDEFSWGTKGNFEVENRKAVIIKKAQA